jgi:outer membrane biogenesis lipoprotein LolB
MNRRTALRFLLLLSLLLSACASTKPSRTWNAGDMVICPHCGREFQLPEKLGKK